MQADKKTRMGEHIKSGLKITAAVAFAGALSTACAQDKTCLGPDNKVALCDLDMQMAKGLVRCVKDKDTYGTYSDCGGPDYMDCTTLYKNGSKLQGKVIVTIQGPSKRKDFFMVKLKDLGDGTTFEREVPSCD